MRETLNTALPMIQARAPRRPSFDDSSKESEDSTTDEEKIRALQDQVTDLNIRLTNAEVMKSQLGLMLAIMLSAIDHGMGWLFLTEKTGVSALKFALQWYDCGFAFAKDDKDEKNEDSVTCNWIDDSEGEEDEVPGEDILYGRSGHREG